MKSMKQIVIGLFSLVMVAHLTLAQNQAAVDANEAEAADLLARFNAALNSAAPSFARRAVDRLNGDFEIREGASGAAGPDGEGGGSGIDDPFGTVRIFDRPPLEGNINLDDCTRVDDPRQCCKILLPIKVKNVTTTRTLTCQKTQTKTVIIYNFRAPRCDLYNMFRQNFFRDCYESQTRTIYLQDVCTVQEVIGVPETQCCPTDRLTCCVGLIYLSPRRVTLRSGSVVVIEEQCATVEEFRMIVGILENPIGSERRGRDGSD